MRYSLHGINAYPESDGVTAKYYRLSTRAEKVTKEEVKTAIQNANDEELSIRLLMSKQESNVIITDPREYQVELFERAKKQNTIAVLDTGSGKTLIAVLLLKHIIDQELEDRSQGKSRRISFFLVRKAFFHASVYSFADHYPGRLCDTGFSAICRARM